MLRHIVRTRHAAPSPSFDALVHRVRKRLVSTKALADAADEVRVVAPAELQSIRPAFHLPHQLERARATPLDSSLACEFAQVGATRVEHAATLALRFRRAVLVDGVLYANGACHPQVYERERWGPTIVRGPEQTGVALPSSVIGNRYFGDFIAGDCAAALLAREHGPVSFTATKTPRSAHALRYLAIHGLQAEEVRSAHLRDAWVFQDFAMTAHKRERYRRMRENVRALPGYRAGHGVFFRRRGAGVHRGLANEAALEARLEREGFEIVDVSREDVDTIVRRTKDAAVVAGVEGSALVHALFAMRPGGAVVCLQPPHRFTMSLKQHADALELHYGLLVGVGDADGFAVAEDELLRTLDVAWSRAAGTAVRTLLPVSTSEPASDTPLAAE